MTSVFNISDSDDSDDLPSFADRVKLLINAERKETKRNISPKQNLSKIHSISDSDDSSRETIPFATDQNRSPVLSLSESPSKINKKDVWSSDDDIIVLNHRTVSPTCSLPDLDNQNFNQKVSYRDSNYLPDFNHNSESPPWNKPELPNYNDLNKEDGNTSIDEDICLKEKSKTYKEKNKNDKEKEQIKKMRLEKKKEKELIKVLKASEKEILKHQKPEECLKNMKIVIDHNILYLEGSQSALNSLDQNNLTHSIEENNCKYSINWYRNVINICTENNEILREEREELEDTLIIMIPNEDFLKMIHAYVQVSKGKSSLNLSLQEFIHNIKALYPDSNITCIIVGFQTYMRKVKNDGSFDIKTLAKQVHKTASEEAIIELQLQLSVNFNFLDDMSEVGNLLYHFTKAIAEAPRKREKQNQKTLAFSWYADVDSHCPIKLSKDGSSFIKLWKQQIQQFQNVGPEVAEAIVSRYPSLRSLLKAYKRCLTAKDAENLLQDIVVRRNYGPLGTQKRIGPELSYKLYLFFTSRDGNKLLKR